MSVLVNGVRWWATAEVAGVLAEPLPPVGLPIKSGPHRAVIRVLRPGLDLFWKHCRLVNFRAWCRDLVRGPKARLEYDKAKALAARGVATVEPLAWGRPAGLGPAESYLLTRSIPDARPLAEYLILPESPGVATPGLRQKFSKRLANFLAHLHAAGVTHPDPHPGNFLLTFSNHQPHFHLIDVHAVGLGRPLDWPASRANLVLFNRWFALRATRTDRLRFWHAYAQARGWPADRQRPRDLELRTAESNRRFWAGRATRRRGGHKLRRVRVNAIVGFATPDVDVAWLHDLLADPDAPFAQPDAKLLKDSRSSTVAIITAHIGGQPYVAIWKRFRSRTRLEPWLSLLRSPPALRSWHAGHMLLDRTLPTPRPLVVAHRQRGGKFYEGYLLTAFVPAALELHEAFARADRCERRALLDALGRLVRQLHERGLAHRDLKAANILIANRAPTLIDLVGLSAPRRVTRRLRVRDLSRLCASSLAHPGASNGDRLRCLRSYLGPHAFSVGDWRSWWADIARRVSAKAAKNERRGRPLA